MSRLYIVIPLIWLICRVHHVKCQDGWSTSWNQDCWEKYQLLQIHRWHHSYGRKGRRSKEPLDDRERGEWKSWLRSQLSKSWDHGIPFSHFLANRWGNNGNSERLYFGGFKVTAVGDCSCEIKRRLLLGRQAMTKLDSILKSRDISLPTNVYLVKAMVFPVVMFGCES